VIAVTWWPHRVTWITNQQMVAARPAGFGEDGAGECRERTMLSCARISITHTYGLRWFADHPATNTIVGISPFYATYRGVSFLSPMSKSAII
jgi:hypothetical protein